LRGGCIFCVTFPALAFYYLFMNLQISAYLVFGLSFFKAHDI